MLLWKRRLEDKPFFTRLHHFVLTSDAFVVAPGGIGTVLELTMIWRLLQVKDVHDTPLILVGNMLGGNSWTGRRKTCKSPNCSSASPADLAIPRRRKYRGRGDLALARPSC